MAPKVKVSLAALAFLLAGGAGWLLYAQGPGGDPILDNAQSLVAQGRQTFRCRPALPRNGRRLGAQKVQRQVHHRCSGQSSSAAHRSR